MSESEFDQLLNNETIVSSWQSLKKTYQSYLSENKIKFMIGTHDIPGSITTHRYKRILKNKNYSRIIVWGAGEYFNSLSDIFNDVQIHYLIDDQSEIQNINEVKVSSPGVLKSVNDDMPIFVCHPNKSSIKTYIQKQFPLYKGQIYV